MMKLSVLTSLFLFFTSASAFAFMCNYNDERVEIPVSVLTLHNQANICPNLAPEASNLPMVLVVTSPGGFLQDMPAIIELCPRTICMNAGRVIADEDTRAVLTDRAVIEAYLGEAAA